MPFPLAPLAPLIAGGAALGSTIIGAVSQGRQNKKSRQWSAQQYNKQRADNIDFWNMQNKYNSPEAQMQRFRQAGLNPNLIYGKGSASAGNADAIKTPDVKQGQFTAPDFSGIATGATSMISQYYDIEMKQAQIDNLKADNTVKQADALLKLATKDRSTFDLNFEKELRTTSADARKEMLRQLMVNNNSTLAKWQRDDKLANSTIKRQQFDVDYGLAKWEREELMNKSNLSEAVMRIAKGRKSIAKDSAEINRINQAIKVMRKDQTLKQLEIEFSRLGISKNEPLWQKIIGRYINSMLNKGYSIQPDGSWK